MNTQTTPQSASRAASNYVDVLIVGAGISGVGVAHHLQEQCPTKTFALLEARDSHGGTWKVHTYPGIRSDSDLYTFGYRFKPWMNAPIAKADLILDYMQDVIDEDDMDQHIHYNHKVIKTEWSSQNDMWTVTVARSDTGEQLIYSCNFLYMCQGYYDMDNPYTPDWDGLADYKGTLVHPQKWPDDLDYEGKKVVVIGSGATAATLIPSMVDKVAHITMLQRSPTYFWTGENRNELADRLKALDLPDEWVHETVRRDILKTHKEVQDLSKAFPDMVKEELLNLMREKLGDEMVEKHFTPSYRPWQQRLAFVPDGDLFEAAASGKFGVVTDHIDHFTETGIKLKSGEELEADIIITATGFNLLYLGGIPFSVDGQLVDFSQRYTYHGLMIEGVPNMVPVFGYLRTSWTMRVDLIGDYVCRLLNHMEREGMASVTATVLDDEKDMPKLPWIEDEEFNSGYLKRGREQMPKNGDRDPWRYVMDYYMEKDMMPTYPLDDPHLRYHKARMEDAA